MAHIKTHGNKRGSALLSALFIMTLVAICATAMSMRLQLDIYRTRLTLDSDKLYLASQAVTFWAMDILSEQNILFKSAKAHGKLIDFPGQLQNIYPDVKTEGSIYDLQAVFNLNNLSDKKFQPLFLNLLEHIPSKMTASAREQLVNAITFAISPYQPKNGQDDALSPYLKYQPPYLPGFQLMNSPSQLRIIANVNAALYQTLMPYITALPEVTPININTASNLLLMSLGNGLSETELNELLQARGKEGFKNLNVITPLLQKLHIPNEQITLESIYYLSLSTTSSTDLNLTLYSVLKRSKDKQGHISIQVVTETLNTP